jgi:hypothetical protein
MYFSSGEGLYLVFLCKALVAKLLYEPPDIVCTHQGSVAEYFG